MHPIDTKTLIVLSLSLHLVACGSGGSSSGSGSSASPNPAPIGTLISEEFQGTWIAEAYGQVVEIGTNTLRLLDYTSESCFLVEEASDVDTSDIETLFRVREDRLEWYAGSGTASFGAPGTRFTAAEFVPASCADGVDPQQGQAGYSADPRRELRLFAQLLEEYSIYPALRELPVTPLYEKQLSQLTSSDSDEALAEALFNIASAYRDIHTTVETSLGLIKVLNKPVYSDRLFAEWLDQQNLRPPLTPVQTDSANTYISEQLELEREITLAYADDGSDIQSTANDLLTWYAVDGVGYLAIDAMLGFGDPEDNDDELTVLESALDEVMNDLRDTQALIVDVRRNGGGKDFLSLAIASRFVANETHAYSKQARLAATRTELIDVFLSPRGEFQYLAPVFLLTSSQTASAAETFTLAMRVLPQVTIVGETTQGGFSDQLEKRLSNGWKVSLANEFYLSPESEEFETEGVPVDLEVPQLQREARLLGTDFAIDAVISMLDQ
ncbi:S41 family peptidase [Congregibacter sp.]|uniref:S41 family peptidase n=1 Tax=Congregibacter sp. TaxID=2744308 RepID=UPI00385BB2B8